VSSSPSLRWNHSPLRRSVDSFLTDLHYHSTTRLPPLLAFLSRSTPLLVLCASHFWGVFLIPADSFPFRLLTRPVPTRCVIPRVDKVPSGKRLRLSFSVFQPPCFKTGFRRPDFLGGLRPHFFSCRNVARAFLLPLLPSVLFCESPFLPPPRLSLPARTVLAPRTSLLFFSSFFRLPRCSSRYPLVGSPESSSAHPSRTV